MNRDILVVGRGYIGGRLAEELDCSVSVDRIGSLEDCLRLVKRRKPKVLINCVGFTGTRNVDDCELDRDKTLTANSFVPVMLAEACLRENVRFVHLSSGCIFEYDYGKQKPVDERLMPDYYDLYYSRSKVYAERCLEYLSRKYPVLIARIRIPLDNRPSPRNIIDKLISFGKVIDIPNSVTYIPDFVRALRHLIKIRASGIYNVLNKGGLRYPELMEIYKKYHPEFSYKIVSLGSLKMKRTNLLMSTRKLEASGFKVRHIRDVLEECVREREEALKSST